MKIGCITGHSPVVDTTKNPPTAYCSKCGLNMPEQLKGLELEKIKEAVGKPLPQIAPGPIPPKPKPQAPAPHPPPQPQYKEVEYEDEAGEDFVNVENEAIEEEQYEEPEPAPVRPQPPQLKRAGPGRPQTASKIAVSAPQASPIRTRPDLDPTVVYRMAIQKYGPVLQAIVALEECSELQKQITKALRGHEDSIAIAEEMADVEIMLDQLKLIYSNHTEVAEMKKVKIARLADFITRSADE